MAETYFFIGVVLLTVSAVGAIVTVVFFFAGRIRDVRAYLTGKTTAAAVAEFRNLAKHRRRTRVLDTGDFEFSQDNFTSISVEGSTSIEPADSMNDSTEIAALISDEQTTTIKAVDDATAITSPKTQEQQTVIRINE